jgi:hypothetical protein
VEAFEGAGFVNVGTAQPVQYFVRMVKSEGTLKVDGFAFQQGSETITGGTTPKVQKNRPKVPTQPTTVPSPE